MWQDPDVQRLFPLEPGTATPVRELGARGSRARVAETDPAADPGVAARAVLAGLPAWWEAVASSHGLTGRWLDVGSTIEADPPPRIAAVQPADLTGLSGADVGTAYSAGLGDDVRARHGRHYTPWALAERLWAGARASLGHGRSPRALDGLVRDPACGAGVLLLPPLREHVRALVSADPREVVAGVSLRVEGIDSDPAAVWIANVVLAAELLPLLARIPPARRRPLPALARTGDGLTVTGRARAIVMNPPYGRVRLSPVERLRWGRYLYGHANLYGLFLGASVEALDDDGVLAAVVPTSFLAGRYFAALRGELAAQAPLRDVTFVELRDGVFAGVLQETCLAVFTRRRPRRTAIASINGVVSDVAQVASPRGTRPWVLPRRADDASVAAAAASLSETLAGAGWRVSTGPLVWNRRRADLRSSGAARCVRVLWAADLDGGTLHRDWSRDRYRWIVLREGDEGVLILDEPAVLVQRTTAPEQRRRVVPVDLDAAALEAWGGRVVVENHVNVIRPIVPEPLISRATLAAVLSTRAIDRITRCISGSVALSAYELESLPLPDAELLAAWETLRGEELEQAVGAAYGLRDA